MTSDSLKMDSVPIRRLPSNGETFLIAKYLFGAMITDVGNDFVKFIGKYADNTIRKDNNPLYQPGRNDN